MVKFTVSFYKLSTVRPILTANNDGLGYGCSDRLFRTIRPDFYYSYLIKMGREDSKSSPSLFVYQGTQWSRPEEGQRKL